MRRTLKHLSSFTAILVASGALIHADPAIAAAIVVANCHDSGAGSLRAAIEATPFTGGTIDLTHLACSRITLTGGALTYSGIGTMNIVGPGKDRLTLDGSGRSGILYEQFETEKSTLRLSGLTLTNGLADGGGCVRTGGNVELSRVSLHHCQARGPGGAVFAMGNASVYRSSIVANVSGLDPESAGAGGGVYAHDLKLSHSRVSGNRASQGGGIVTGGFTASYSLIDHNTAADSGGVEASGHVEIWKSTISDNRASHDVGAIYLAGDGHTLIVDSTISRNSAPFYSGALIFEDATVVNSTIAFNRGIDASCAIAVSFDRRLHLESSIVASNGCRYDLLGDPAYGAIVIGSHNIVGTSYQPIPGDTIRTSPRLGPLANNGGPTPTHALLCDSPAIDRGNNVLNLAYDQRGPGHPRVKGFRADIGAFER